ncbi:hypothetical protein C1645_830438 [Glomus cerebriforme]|uniref:Uncharacterized protein n=1 Tax=Glomus cerebriforme TaxID=658196 RepID=A0A397SM28_9GLOM|nr:hypothetical protein C1645_830438 [Glomus cerebriforme]
MSWTIGPRRVSSSSATSFTTTPSLSAITPLPTNTALKTFRDKIHDTDLIIEICDDLRPPIVTNALEGWLY